MGADPLGEPRKDTEHEVATGPKQGWSLVGTHLEVLVDRQGGEHVVDLGHIADTALHESVGLEAGDIVAAQFHRARVHLEQPEQGLQHRRFAGAVGADDADQLARVEFDARPIEDVHAGHITGDDRVDVDQELGRLGHWSPPSVRLVCEVPR